MLAAVFQATQQQLGIGPEGRKRIAQLMNQGLQLVLLVVQRLAELQTLQITPKSMADGSRTVPECLVDFSVPRLRWGQIRPQGAQDQIAIL